MKPLIILNPHAGSGRALRQFHAIEPLLPLLFEAFLVAVTAHPEEAVQHLALAAEAGYDTLLALGGDGTNRALVNALAREPGHPFAFGTLPLGTGRDWARTLGIPYDPEAALRWLARAEVRPVDVGRVTADGESSFFLNVASAGISGEVGRRVNRARAKQPWTFVAATVSTLLQFGATPMRVWLDGQSWYEGDAFLLAVGNGRFFARGMMVCPDAQVDDGRFDVVLVEGMRRLEAIAALPSLFRGAHVQRGDVHVLRARHVRVAALDAPLGMEADGEPSDARTIEFEVLPRALPMLLDPAAAAVQG